MIKTQEKIRKKKFPDYGTCEVADQALAHMMNLARKISYADGLIHQGVWDYRRNLPTN